MRIHEIGHGRGNLALCADVALRTILSEQEAVLKATAVQSPLLVMWLILPYPPYLPPVILSLTGGGGPAAGGCLAMGGLGGGLGRGRGVGGGGQGTFHPPCHILHYHMVLCPEGSSHNEGNVNGRPSILFRTRGGTRGLFGSVVNVVWPVKQKTNSR